MKKVAVVGASGFVGQSVRRALERRSLAATLIRRGQPGLADPGWTFWDINQLPTSLEQIGNPEVVIHLAWSHLENYRSLAHFEKELPLQYRFLQRLIELGLPRLVVSGTCLEYGHQFGPLNEQAAVSPTTAYGLAKDGLRRQLEQLAKQKPFELIWGRLFYVFGEGQRESSIFTALKLAVGRGDRQFNMSSGEQLRDFLPIEEAAERLVELALSDQSVGVVNICSGRAISVRRLVEEWLAANNWRIDLNLGHYPLPDYESLAFWGDPRKFEDFRARESR